MGRGKLQIVTFVGVAVEDDSDSDDGELVLINWTLQIWAVFSRFFQN